MAKREIRAKQKQPAPPLKDTKLFENFLRVAGQFVQGKNYRPLTLLELAAKLSILKDHFTTFQQSLAQLEKEGKIALKEGKYHSIAVGSADLVRGIIRMNQRGFGFVEADDSLRFPQDIFIPKHSTNHAIDGDMVEVAVASVVSEKGPEGKVVNILERSRTHLAGIVVRLSGSSAEVYVPLLGSEQSVLCHFTKDSPLIVGDRIVMEVSEWGSQRDSTECKLSHKIGHISDPSCDIPAAIEEFGIRNQFPEAAIEEARAVGKSVPAKTIKEREDLRELETFTIDPDTAKDYDDAVTLTRGEKGLYHLIVHIADVSHYVQTGSELDKEAFLRANSTYFPGKCIPMLPSELSDNLCSLKPNVNRLTVSVFMDFDASGSMVQHRIAKTVIHSQKRFTYREAKRVLDGKVESPHSATLKLMVELCLLLKKKRYERGSVEFAMPELVVLVDEKGVPTGTDYVEYDITHQLIEEFMLKANETVAQHLDQKGKGVPYRVHDVPSEENMRDFALLANAFGFKLPPAPTAHDVQNMFEEALKTPYGQYLATSYIRRMRLAVYSPVNIGHFGLALTHYCHFTSPIRRYVDLVAHRLVFTDTHDIQTLNKIADRCSERERISAKAEGSVVTLKKYRLLEKLQQENPHREYQAVITRIKPFGIYFEILELMLEGFIHISEIGTDYYEFSEKDNRLIGVKRGEQFIAGNKIWVMLQDINLITCESKWYMVGGDDTGSQPKEKRQFQDKGGHPKEKSSLKEKAPAKDKGQKAKEPKAKKYGSKDTSRDKKSRPGKPKKGARKR